MDNFSNFSNKLTNFELFLGFGRITQNLSEKILKFFDENSIEKWNFLISILIFLFSFRKMLVKIERSK